MNNEAVGIFTSLALAEKVPPQWVLENLLPVGLTFLAAPPKAYKSTLELGMALIVAGYKCGILPDELGQLPKGAHPGRVVGLSFEASAGELRHMAEEGLGVRPLKDDDAILICDEPYDFRIDDVDGAAKLIYWLEELKPRMVFLDPLRDLHSLDEANSGDMNRVLRPLQKWAKENNAAVLVVHHTRKPGDNYGGKSTATDMRGSSALFGLADGVLMMTPRDSMQVIIQATFKRAAGWERTLSLGAYGGGEAVEEEGDLERRVLALIKEDMTLSAIAKQLRLGKPRIVEVTRLMARRGKVKKVDNKWVAVFPEAK